MTPESSCICTTPFGPVFMAAGESGLSRLIFTSQSGTGIIPEPLKPVSHWLEAYFAGEKPGIDQLLLAPRGTIFQHRVWKAMLAIPYGRTTTYGALASQLGTSPRAIGGAAARNPIFIIVPCHRVIGINGEIKGYAGGIEQKRRLLRHEGWAQFPPSTKARG